MVLGISELVGSDAVVWFGFGVIDCGVVVLGFAVS